MSVATSPPKHASAGADAAIELGIGGMTCASCAGRVERAIRAVPGVREVAVNLATERAHVAFAPDARPDAAAVAAAVAGAGYEARPETVELAIEGMTCASCAGRVERALARVPGVVSATVNLASEQASVETAGASAPALIAAVERGGYHARLRPAAGAAADAGRERAALRERRHVAIAAILTIPLIVPMLLGLAGVDVTLPGWRRWRSRRRCSSGSARASTAPAGRRCAPARGNMDLLVALGTSAAYGLSLYLLAGARRPAGMPHLYFEASAVVITLVLLGKWLEARAKRQTGGGDPRADGAAPRARARARATGRSTRCRSSRCASATCVVVRPGERMPVDGTCVEGAQRTSTNRCSPARACRSRRRRATASPAAPSTATGCWCVEATRGRRRDHAGAHHPAGRGRAGRQGADPAPGRPRQRGVRAGGARHRRC